MSDEEQIEGMEEAEEQEEAMEQEGPPEVYLPDMPLKEDEELVCDESTYVMYHQAQTGAPCLSFDVMRDRLGSGRSEPPHSLYLTCGTQAERGHTNSVIVLRMTNLRHTKKEEEKEEDEEEEEDDSDDDADEDEKPELEAAMIQHTGAVNRIRSTVVGEKQLAASWSDTGKVYVWDLARPLAAVEDPQVMAQYTRDQESPAPLFTFPGHMVEGFALDWSSCSPGRLASGDCNKNIHVWNVGGEGRVTVEQKPYTGHTMSVEDIQWSPSEPTVFASCSVDRSVRIWDVRAKPNAACMLAAPDAHERDVNVISWNRNEPFIVSGGDDGALKVWDLRKFKSGAAVATFRHHRAPITSVEWHPTDGSVFAAAGEDDQLTQWDLAVERDESEGEAGTSVPPQLLFIHQGQKDIKELHWHAQIPGLVISTALSGFNIFRTISV